MCEPFLFLWDGFLVLLTYPEFWSAISAAGIAFGLVWWNDRKKSKDKIKAHKAALMEEVKWNIHQAGVYIDSKITNPTYLLPIFSYEISYPALLSENKLNSEIISKIQEFYSSVTSLNTILKDPAGVYSLGCKKARSVIKVGADLLILLVSMK